MEIDLTTIGRSLRLLRPDKELDALLRLCVSMGGECKITNLNMYY